jgi:hypothetical protein
MPNDINTPFTVSQPLPVMPGPGVEPTLETPHYASDEEILALWEVARREDLDGRKAFDNQWRRNIYYVLNRQWLEYIAGRGWRDKRMAPWIPRPVTNKCGIRFLALHHGQCLFPHLCGL